MIMPRIGKPKAKTIAAILVVCAIALPCWAWAGNGGDRGGGGEEGKKFADIGRRLFQAVADQCTAGAAGNDSQPESLVDPRLVEAAVLQMIDPRDYRAVCNAIVFKTGDEFASAFMRTHVVRSATPVLGSDQNPRDAINNRRDLITLSPGLWQHPAANMDEVQDRLGLAAHEYLSVANLEESDQYTLSSRIVRFLADAGATDLAAIYGSLPITPPLRFFSATASATVLYSKTRQAVQQRDPGHIFSEPIEEPCVNAKKSAKERALASCSAVSSNTVCKTIRFEVLKATPIEETFGCKNDNCPVSCTVRVSVGEYPLAKK